MSKWVLVFFCCLASNALASSADSGRCPWKIPFTLKIIGIGVANQSVQWRYGFNSEEQFFDTTISRYIDTFEIIVDTTFAYLNDSVQYYLNSDYLFFYTDRSTSGMSLQTSLVVGIVFSPGTDSIISLVVSGSESGNGHGGHGAGDYTETYTEKYSFQVASLLFDDTSIFTADSSFSDHGISISRSDDTMYNADQYDFDYLATNFTASSLDLSGIFRPTHFANQASVSAALPVSSNSIALYPNPASSMLTVQFAPLEEDGQIKLFDNLGITKKSFPISPGAASAELFVSDLPNGFYTLAFGQDRQRVVVLH